MNLLKLQSGSDIRGNAVQSQYGEITLTDDAVSRIAIAFVSWLSEKLNIPKQEIKIAVGNDSRISAPRIKEAFTSPISNIVSTIYNCGLCPTPAMFMAVNELSCHGTVEITASHHPYYKNGLKFFTADGGLDNADIQNILTEASNLPNVELGSCDKVIDTDFIALYTKNIRSKIIDELNDEQPLKGFKIVVDAGNGAGGFFADKILAPLGCDITGSQFLEPDGLFPNHIPNPEDAEAMASISLATTKNNADLGLIFDTDVDRAACVDALGNEINKNNLIALAACIVKNDNLEKIPTIVTDSTTSEGLELFLKDVLHVNHYRYKRGYKNVINKAIELNSDGIYTPLAIETSGHAALLENHMLDDGAYLMTKIIILMVKLKRQNKSLFDLIKTMPASIENYELRLKLTSENFANVGNDIINSLDKSARAVGYNISDDSHEGIRISFNDKNLNGRALLRLSVHDPIMPLNLESNTIGGCKLIADTLIKLIDNKDIDLSSLTNFIKQK